MENTQNIENKITVYKQALEEVIKELTQKRTDLATAARQTVENLETSIPSLRSQVSDLNGQLEELNKKIAARQAELDAKKDTLDAHYKMLEGLLKEEYIKRKQDLDAVEDAQRLTAKHFNDSSLEMTSREQQFIGRMAELNNKMNELRQKEDKFNQYEAIELRTIEERKTHISNAEQNLKVQEEVSNKRVKELNIIESKLALMVQEAENTILRIEEANNTLALAKEIEAKFTEREEKLNQANTKLIVDSRRNIVRNDELDDKEAKLNVRENNIKLAEAALSKV